MSERYARHNLIAGWNQHALSETMVIVVGMGALGNEVARMLAMSGVGQLIICDPDQVEVSNLSRMLLFRPADLGRAKVAAAADTLAQMAPDMHVDPRPWPLVHGVGLAELRDASLVMSCLDSHAARLQLAGRCQLVQAACIDGGTHPWGGEVRLFLDPAGPCYGCGLSAADRAVVDAPWSCLDQAEAAPVGSAVPSSALIGTWMGMMGVRFLLGLPCPDGLLSIDGSRGTSTIVPQQRAPDCPLHVPTGPVSRIAVRQHDSVGQLREALPPQSIPLAWEPVQYRAECPHCGFTTPRWKLPALDPCPRCGRQLRPHTTLELDLAPEALSLADLGIAPREILAIRTPDGIQWVELEA